MNQRNATHGNDDKLVRGPEDVPAGLSDEEQLEFWETHEITEEFLAKTEEVPADERPRPRPRDRHGTVRLDKKTVEALSALAEARGVPLQTLARELLLEGVRRARREADEQEIGRTGHERTEAPTRREEAPVERVPVEDEATEVRIGEDEVEVPVTEEETIVEDRIARRGRRL